MAGDFQEPAQLDLPGLLDALKQHLVAMGIEGVPRSTTPEMTPAAEPDTAPETEPAAAAGRPHKELALSAGEIFGAVVHDEPKDSEASGEYAGLGLDEMEKLAQGCRKCRLCEGRNKVVFGTGCKTNPPIVFVGEGPGADEDRIGEPFVGKAGALLTAAITKGLGLRREDVYICNVVKCRPPGNRTPAPDEAKACTPYLFRQLELLQPKVIVALGSPAQMALCGEPGGITRLRGKWLSWRGVRVMPTFHPAYLLRNPAAKRDFWEDLQAVMAEVGLVRKVKSEDGA